MADEATTSNALPVDDTLVLGLKKPVIIGGKSYETLALREPNAMEMRKAAAAESGIAQTMMLCQMVAGVPMMVVEQMTTTDIRRADAFFARFLTAPLDTPS